MKEFILFIKMFFNFDLPLFPKMMIIFWVVLPLIVLLILNYEEKHSNKEYEYYKNNIYKQWRKFK